MKKSHVNTRLGAILAITLAALVITGTALAASAWVNVGSAGFSAGSVYSTSLALDGSNIPYVAYRDGANGNKATVMRFNGTTWETVGTPGFSAGSVDPISLALGGSTPYVAYRDLANGSKVTVMRFNGTTWDPVGTPGFSAGSVNYTSLALDGSNIPYVAYRDDANGSKATVMRFNGTTWETVGTPGFSAGIVEYISLALGGSTPYVAYTDGANGSKFTVMRFNGTTWDPVGTPGFSAGSGNSTSLALDGSNIPYVAYRDFANSDKATVMRFNGTTWETVGTPGFSAGWGVFTSLALDGSTPYVAYRDGANGNKATVMRFNGTNWEAVGTPAFSAGIANDISLALDGSTPYVAYTDDANGDKATVMRLEDYPDGNPSVTGSKPANGAKIPLAANHTLVIQFDRDLLNDGSADAANNADNYLLVEAMGDGFQTTSCATGQGAGDARWAIPAPVYDNSGGEFKVTIGPWVLQTGTYRLFVCGSSTIYDTLGNPLNGGVDTVIDFSIIDPATIQAETLPKTGFKPGMVTIMPPQKASERYAQMSDISLRIPALEIEAPIVGVPIAEDGWNLNWLGNQAGWLHGSAFPSWAGNSAITAHVVDANGQPGLFSDLESLKWGDEVIVNVYGQSYIYEVREIDRFVHPDNTESIYQHEKYPWLTLITCKGYDEESDSYRWRVVVRAVQTKIR